MRNIFQFSAKSDHIQGGVGQILNYAEYSQRKGGVHKTVYEAVPDCPTHFLSLYGNQHSRIVCRYGDKAVLPAVVAVASYFQIGTFKQPGGKSRFFSCGGEGSCFLLWCFVVRVSVDWLVVLLSGVMNRERLVM